MSLFQFEPKNQNIFAIESSNQIIKPKYNKHNQLDFSLNKNIDVFKDLLHFPDSNDLIFRFFNISINNEKYNSMIILYDGLCDTNIINDYILKQLMKNIIYEQSQNKSVLKHKKLLSIKDILVGNVLSESQISFSKTYSDVIEKILHGDCALIIDTFDPNKNVNLKMR